MKKNIGLVYVGKIIAIEEIPNADFIVSATVVCGVGGKWRGIVKKGDFEIDSKCIVYLPDTLIAESEEMAFMKSSNWRVKMRRFRGAPSEVVIMPEIFKINTQVGEDITLFMNVTKYHKPMPAHLNGMAIGHFPDFIPKTDEPNYQRSQELIDLLEGKPYYITEKADGSSTTAFKYKNHFGLCSRNLELAFNEENGYWKIALRYDLSNKLPEGIALQWETCGPGIQGNPMGLKEIEGYAFSAYNIVEHRYLTMQELLHLCSDSQFLTVAWLKSGESFDKKQLEYLGEGTYSNGKPREGVVVRSQENLLGHAPISFKVINLGYEK
jgi:RNA ligase (TIGR02306 family)